MPRQAAIRCALLVLALSLRVSPALAGWQAYSNLDGFPSRTVTVALGDRAGNLWFATDAPGVSRYDGASWRHYRVADGLPSDTILCITETRGGDLWFGTPHGISRYDGSAWGPVLAIGGLTSNQVLTIYEDHTGALWVGTPRGASRWDGNRWTPITVAHGLAHYDVTAIVEDRRGALWFGSREPGVTRFDGVSIDVFGPLIDGYNFYGTYLSRDSTGAIWFGGPSSDLWRYDGAIWRRWGINDGLSGAIYHGPVFTDRSGSVWVSEMGRAVSGFDGTTWRNFSTLNPQARDGLPPSDVLAIAQDRDGNLWFGTRTDGVIRFDGSSWRVYTLWSGGSTLCQSCGAKDAAGNLWFASNGRIHRYDGFGWQTFTDPTAMSYNLVNASLALANGKIWFATFLGILEFDPSTGVAQSTGNFDYVSVQALAQDPSGVVWVGTVHGLYVSSGLGYRSFTLANTGGALPSDFVHGVMRDNAGIHWITAFGRLVRVDASFNFTTVRTPRNDDDWVTAMLIDHRGDRWFATRDSLLRFDGARWHGLAPDGGNFGSEDGVAGFYVNSLFEDSDRNLWVGTSSRGALRFDGVEWGSYTAVDGIQSSEVGGILQDRKGTLWFEGLGVVSGLDPDRTPPRTVVTLAPSLLSAHRSPTVAFGAAYDESYGILHSLSFDGAAWSPWSSSTLWSAENLADGTHELRIRSRDKIGNVDATPAVVSFEIDATPPAPRIDFPLPRQIVRDSIEITGVAADDRLAEFRLELGPSGSSTWTLLRESSVSVDGGSLYGWNTRQLPDGDYDLRLTVTDTIGLSAEARVSVTIDNTFPNVDVTVPALVREADGGSIYTVDGDVHLYFPPHAFARDAIVSVREVPLDSLPASLPSGATPVRGGHDFSWNAELEKPARLDVVFGTISRSGDSFALHYSPDGASWVRLGGTLAAERASLSLAVDRPGRYAVFEESESVHAGGAITSFALTPRVFSPTGRFADREVGISFSLGRAAPVTIRVYSASGRLIREVENGRTMGAGANLVRWNGRDRDGAIVFDGLYLVTIEALGRVERKPLAVVK